MTAKRGPLHKDVPAATYATPAATNVLLAIAALTADGVPATLRGIGELTGYHLSQTHKAVLRLEGLGLVQRAAGQDDKTAVGIVLARNLSVVAPNQL